MMVKERDFDFANTWPGDEVPLETCNMCGKKFDYWDFEENCRFDHRFGFGSKYDCYHLDLNLCCECTSKVLDWLLPQCKINPMTEDPEPVSFPPATDKELDELYGEQSEQK